MNLMTTINPVRYCKLCVMSSQRPRITFDSEGVCSACSYAYRKHNVIDWKLREKELRDLLDKYRRNDGSWDVVVPASGGKDSSFVAHQLKYKYNMNPLTVTWAPHVYTDIGWQNFQAMLHSGLDNISGQPNGIIHRKLTRLFFEKIGDPFQPFIFGQKSFPVKIAVKYNIPLIMYGENGEVEYGGDRKNENSPTHNLDDDVIKHYFSGISPEDLVAIGFDKKEINPYLFPPMDEIHKVGVQCHFFGYYKKWTPQENFYYAVKNCGFKPNPERSEGTYSKYASIDDKIDGFHYYLMFLKFGIGRATSDAAHEIRDGHITRDEGVALVRRYDGEFPKKHFKVFLDYINMTEENFWEVLEKFRAKHLWEKTGGIWRLKYQVTPHEEYIPNEEQPEQERICIAV
ncbi:MAG: N-acetyl sugar amidotransferase [Desulfobacterales bacterium]|nr:N-acetyl sugar amidotransferase [Desulfobacterales bacterium]MBF0398339.1 N-acetyl sugar amidotransferase [Desulfobacterales bacterium]